MGVANIHAFIYLRKRNMKENTSTSNAAEQTGQNIMGYLPCRELLIKLSLPMMLSMMVQALYNIVDSIFVAQMNEAALTAVSLAFPIQSLLIAIGSGTGVGINARLSRKLGEKKPDEVNVTAGNAIFIAIVYAVIFLLAGQFICKPFYTAIRWRKADRYDLIDLMRYGVVGGDADDELAQ